MLHQTVVLKKVGKNFEGVLARDNRFERSLGGETLEEAALKGLASILSQEIAEGGTISFDVQIESYEEITRARALEDAAREERLANEELTKLEAAHAAREKVKAAREALRGQK